MSPASGRSAQINPRGQRRPVQEHCFGQTFRCRRPGDELRAGSSGGSCLAGVTTLPRTYPLPSFHPVSQQPHCADRSSTNSQTLHSQCAMDAPTMVPVRFRSQAKSSAGKNTARRQGAGVSR